MVRGAIDEALALFDKLNPDIPHQKFKTCFYCNSINLIRHGGRKTKNRGWIQRYYCKDCKKSFTSKGDVLQYRMRHQKEIIEKALKLRLEGNSLRDIAKQIGVSSHQAILRWLKKFQPPKTEITITKQMKSRWGVFYNRNFQIRV
jgi:transposase-like protein